MTQKPTHEFDTGKLKQKAAERTHELHEKAQQETTVHGHKMEKGDIFKFVGLIAFFAIMVIICLLIWPYVADIFEPGGIDRVIADVRGAGPVGFLILLGLEVLFLHWGFRFARRQTGLLARSVCMGVMLTFALQTALYVLQNFGFMLLSAYGLPLLSYGGNYLFQSMFLLGVLLSAQRTGRLESGLAPRVSCVSEVGT